MSRAQSGAPRIPRATPQRGSTEEGGGTCAARPRAWPAGDLGLRKAVHAFYGDVDVRATGDRFDPFQNLTAHYLLTGLRVVGT